MMRSVVLARRPQGNPVEADFALSEAPLPAVTEGTFLTRNDFISLDAGFRNWMNEDSGDEVLHGVVRNFAVEFLDFLPGFLLPHWKLPDYLLQAFLQILDVTFDLLLLAIRKS